MWVRFEISDGWTRMFWKEIVWMLESLYGLANLQRLASQEKGI